MGRRGKFCQRVVFLGPQETGTRRFVVGNVEYACTRDLYMIRVTQLAKQSIDEIMSNSQLTVLVRNILLKRKQWIDRSCPPKLGQVAL